MASTSMSLGKYWEKFLKDKVKSGQYGSASEVVRAALRTLEAREVLLEDVRAQLRAARDSGIAGDADEAMAEDIKQGGRKTKQLARKAS